MLIRFLNEKGLIPMAAMLLFLAGMLVFAAYDEPNTQLAENLSKHWAIGWLTDFPAVGIFLGTIAMVTLILVVRVYARRIKLGSKSGNLEALIVSAIVFSQNGALYRTDVLTAAAVTSLLFLILTSVYKEETPLSRLFNIGSLFTIGILFVGQSVLVVLAIYFALVVLRPGNWREWISPFLGALMAFIFMALIIIWEPTPLLEFQRIITSSWIDKINWSKFTAANGVLAVMMIPALLQAFSVITTGTITERNYALVLIGWLISIILSIFIFGLDWQMAFLLISLPVSVFIVRWLITIRRWWVADLLLLAIIAAPFLSNLWQL